MICYGKIYISLQIKLIGAEAQPSDVEIAPPPPPLRGGPRGRVCLCVCVGGGAPKVWGAGRIGGVTGSWTINQIH